MTFARSVTHMHDEDRALTASTVQMFFVVAVQNKASHTAVTSLLTSRQEANRIATMIRAATNIQYFSRLVTQMHDEKRVIAARTVQGFFLMVVAKEEAAHTAVARLLAPC